MHCIICKNETQSGQYCKNKICNDFGRKLEQNIINYKNKKKLIGDKDGKNKKKLLKDSKILLFDNRVLLNKSLFKDAKKKIKGGLGDPESNIEIYGLPLYKVFKFLPYEYNINSIEGVILLYRNYLPSILENESYNIVSVFTTDRESVFYNFKSLKICLVMLKTILTATSNKLFKKYDFDLLLIENNSNIGRYKLTGIPIYHIYPVFYVVKKGKTEGVGGDSIKSYKKNFLNDLIQIFSYVDQYNVSDGSSFKYLFNPNGFGLLVYLFVSNYPSSISYLMNTAKQTFTQIINFSRKEKNKVLFNKPIKKGVIKKYNKASNYVDNFIQRYDYIGELHQSSEKSVKFLNYWKSLLYYNTTSIFVKFKSNPFEELSEGGLKEKIKDLLLFDDDIFKSTPTEEFKEFQKFVKSRPDYTIFGVNRSMAHNSVIHYGVTNIHIFYKLIWIFFDCLVYSS